MAGARGPKPHEQFSHQINKLEKRVFEADVNGTHRIPVGSDPRTIAHDNVKKLWVEQGIWNNHWDYYAYGRWKHEEPLQLESESENKSEAGRLSPLFPFFPKPQPKSRQLKSDDEERRIIERRVIREREREASRPYHQFVYQVNKERERIQDESANGEGADAAEINTTAYENVKNTWTKRGIWNKRWGVLPGMSWKHEQPIEVIIREEMGDSLIPASPLINSNYKAPAAIRFFGSPSPSESNHRLASGALNSSQKDLFTEIDSAGLEDSDAKHSFSISNSPPPNSDKRLFSPITGRALLPSKRKAFNKNRQSASISLSLGYSSKISKTTERRKEPLKQPNIARKASSNNLPFSFGVAAAEPQSPPSPDYIAPRRSSRIQPPSAACSHRI